MDIRGTKTQENLLRAFNVESEAKNKYEIYAAKAKKTAMSKLPLFFWRRPEMNTLILNYGLNY